MKIKLMTPFLKLFLSKNIIGISLAPFGIYLSKLYINNAETINHEKIHWKQQLELGIIFFYLLYLIEWITKSIILWENGYQYISFEWEARKNENDKDYLKTRKPYSWLKYI